MRTKQKLDLLNNMKTWEIWKRGTLFEPEVFSFLEHNLKQLNSVLLLILCMMAIRDWQISSLYRIPCTQTTNQRQDKPHSFQENLKNVERNFGKERVEMDLIQDIIFWKDRQAVILNFSFFIYTEPIKIKLDIFLLWKIILLPIC